MSRKGINSNALKVLYRLTEAGYAAYLVGGGVRDLLVGIHPKDFDVATDAKPEQVKSLFRRCFIIGKRFRLAHVYFGLDKVEVVTFRGHSVPTLRSKKSFLKTKQGMVVRDNIFGNMEEDAQRRDLTINALYYNIVDFSLVDYCGGLSDINNKIVRIIGEPTERYHEDPVRMLRVIRFATKLNFTIEEKTAAPLAMLGNLLQHIPPSRLYEEVLKLFSLGSAEKTLQLLQQYDLLRWLLGQTDACLRQTHFQHNKLLNVLLISLDKRYQEGKSVYPEFLFAGLLWAPMMKQYYQYQNGDDAAAYERAINAVLSMQARQVAIVRRVAMSVRDIWHLQRQLLRPNVHASHLVHHKRFRSSLNFLVLRVESGEPYAETVSWWSQFREGDEAQRQAMLAELSNKPLSTQENATKRRRRRNRNKRKPR